MSTMGLLRLCGRLILDFVIITIALLLFPGIPPNANFESKSGLSASPELAGVLAEDARLAGMERWLESTVSGPESVAVWDGQVYTGIEGGVIIRVTGPDSPVPVAKIGQACDGPWDVARCGRPLGLKFDRHGYLFVADAYYGINKVNVTTGDVQSVVPAGLAVPGAGAPLRFFNDVTVARDGVLYFTTSSEICDLHTGFMELSVSGTGRLFRHDPRNNSTELLMSGLNFANGVSLNAQETAVIVSETAMFRIHRYWLRGKRAGQSEVFTDNLPGFPDNVRPRPGPRGGYYVGLCFLRYQNKLHEQLRPYPLLRKLLLRIYSVAVAPVKLIESLYPNYFTKSIIYKGLTMDKLQTAAEPHGMVVELDDRGAVVGSLHTRQMACVSEMSEHDGDLYLGSPFHDFLGHATRGARVKIKSVKVEDGLSIVM